MVDIYLVTTGNVYFAQKKYPWQSMNVNYIKEKLEVEGYKVAVVSFCQLSCFLFDVKGKIIIYTSSQVKELKLYINDFAYFLKDNNMLIPSYESLLAHDNKGFQVLLNGKYGLNLIDSRYYPDLKDLCTKEKQLPFVLKTVDGASSHGVSLIKDKSDIARLMSWPKLFDNKSFALKAFLKKMIFRYKYDSDWELYRTYGNKRYIAQNFIDGLEGDYKVLVFGDKYYTLKRGIRAGDFKASGSGLHSRDFDDEIFLVLDQAKEFVSKYKSHLYSLDICISNGQAFLIEFQFTHVGPVTLTESNFFYRFENNKWNKISSVSNLEQEFVNSVVKYIGTVN